MGAYFRNIARCAATLEAVRQSDSMLPPVLADGGAGNYSKGHQMNIFQKLTKPKFQDFAEQWIADVYAPNAPSNHQAICNLFNKKIYPVIGVKRIHLVTHHDIIEIVKDHRETAPKRVKRTVQFLNRIFMYAEMCGYEIHNPVKSSIKMLFPDSENGEFAVLTMSQIPAFFQQIDEIKVKKQQTKIAFWLLAYTALRRNEVMNATWEEFDLNEKLWIIPRERMKTRHNHHQIPLAEQVINLLRELQSETGRTNGQLFDINPSSPWHLCKATGFQGQMTLHGMRKVFSTHAHESKLWSIDAIELQLAHKIGGIRGVYNHAQHIEERRDLMEWYADEVNKWRNI